MRKHEWISCLIGNVPEFTMQAWQHSPVHRRACTDCVNSLFSVNEVASIVGSSFARGPFVRLVKDGTEIPVRRFARSHVVNSAVMSGFPDETLVTTEVRDGATIVLDALHLGHQQVQEAVRAFSETFGQIVQANAYITPPYAQGLKLHCDRDDVFVIQCAGSKDWTLYEPTEPWPVKGGAIGGSKIKEPSLRIRLTHGDVLYIPRGWAHMATTNDELSVHVTIGILTLTVAQALQALLEVTANHDRELRRAFRLDDPEAGSIVLGAVDRLMSTISEEDIADLRVTLHKQLRDSLRSTEPGSLVRLLAYGDKHAPAAS